MEGVRKAGILYRGMLKLSILFVWEIAVASFFSRQVYEAVHSETELRRENECLRHSFTFDLHHSYLSYHYKLHAFMDILKIYDILR